MAEQGNLSRRGFIAGGVGAAALVATAAVSAPGQASASTIGARNTQTHAAPDFGPNVVIFDPQQSAADIQSKLDAINAQQQDSQFGTGRYAVLFKPGSYDVSFDIGYYTSVAGLGQSPDDVTINGTANAVAVGNASDTTFWRSIENVHVLPQSGQTPMWACAQACPIRRVHLGGTAQLWIVDAQNGYASGGFISDSLIEPEVYSGGQQQYLTRDSVLGGGWSNGNWNQVFSGVVGAPAQSFPSPPYTTLPTSPVTREKPFLQVDSRGRYSVFVPALRRNSSGTTWSSSKGGARRAAGQSIAIEQFYLAKPSDSARTINRALATGKHLILTPGIYELDAPLSVTRPGTVVLGLGFPTLTPTHGTAALEVADVPGVKVAGLLVDPGPVNSDVLVRFGGGSRAFGRSSSASRNDPASIQDVFFRIGGATLGTATTTLEINSANVIIDNIWAWRADHGNAGTVGWDLNKADTGLVVTGDNVTAYGLFVEHYQKTEVVWSGDNGTVVFFQNEFPYDPPSQAAWKRDAATDGYPAFEVTSRVKKFNGYGMGSYSFFNDNSINVTRAFEAPDTRGVKFESLVLFGGTGTIEHIINNTGGPATNYALVDLVAYP